jgi:signal recognition particle subunit SRP54
VPLATLAAPGGGCARGASRRLIAPSPRAESFSTLSTSLQKAWGSLKGTESLTAENIKGPMRDIRRALLEADVSLPVVRRFVARVEAAAVGAAVTKGVSPDQQLVKVVADELVALMGGVRGDEEPLSLTSAPGPVGQPPPPPVILMAGLQGVGKTTACGKLALYLREKGRKPLLVATDVYRPAAIDQLVKLGQQTGVEVFEMGNQASPPAIAAAGIAAAAARGCDVVIIDTAGRTQIDEAMMMELQAVKAATRACETLLVVDAMTGQEAAGLTAAFNEAVGITGAVLTKMDGDARGGAALSVREVSGAPIKFVGTGEKMAALQPFYPERMTSRILGMGDVVTLVERAQKAVADSDAAEMQRRMLEAQFDFNDFLKQAEMVANMGSMSSLMRMMPGMQQLSDKQLAEAERSFKVSKSLVMSMTPEERVKPELIAASVSRRRRIARGAGRTDSEVVTLIELFASMRSRMQDMGRLMKIAGGKVGQMSEEEMNALVGAKKRVAPGMARRKRDVSQRKLASAEMARAAEKEAQQRAEIAAQVEEAKRAPVAV